MKIGTAFDPQYLPAYRITSVRERGFPTRTVSTPTLIALPAQLEGLAVDFFYPAMVQVKYRGEWYLISRKALSTSSVLHPAVPDPDEEAPGPAAMTSMERSCAFCELQ